MFKPNTKNLKIKTPKGWKHFAGVVRSGPVTTFTIVLQSGKYVKCTGGHLLFLSTGDTIMAERALNRKIITEDGTDTVVQLYKNEGKEYVYDVAGVEDTQNYYTGGILSHNCNIMADFWSAVIPAISSSKKSKIFMVSTPAGTENKFYEIHTQAELDSKKAGWTAIRIDWFDVPGRDQQWYEETLSALGGDTKLFQQEFCCKFLDKNESAIGLDILREFKELNKQPLWTSEDGEYMVFEKPNLRHLYVVGVDVGEGIGGASTCSQVLDITDLTNIRQVASFTSNITEPHHYGHKLHILLNSWGRPPVLIERNNCGGQLIDALFYNHEYDKIVAYSKSRSNSTSTTSTSNLGILSTANLRFLAVQNMRYYINTLRAVQVYDKYTISELETFVRHPNNIYRKQNGDSVRDDRVLALIWGLYVLEPDICSLYFSLEEHDHNLKPLKISPLEGVHETLPEFYRVRDLTTGLDSELTPTWVREELAQETRTEIASWVESFEEKLEVRMETEEDYLEAGWEPLNM